MALKQSFACSQVSSALWNELESLDPRQIDIDSVSQVERCDPDVAAQLTLLDVAAGKVVEAKLAAQKTGPQCLYPFRILYDDSGVEWRDRYALRYRSASQEAADEAEEQLQRAKQDRAADIAHCEKLLHDLPLALASSEKAQSELEEQLERGEEADMSAIGPMRLEQRRIQKEIEAQQAKLQQMKASPEPTLQIDASKYEWVEKQRSVTMPWGYSEWEGKLYNLSRKIPVLELRIVTTAVDPPQSD